MEPMKPMEPMQQWWPDHLGQPASTGAQNGVRYAIFPGARRLLIEADGRLTTYDTADHQIGGIAQRSSQALVFSSNDGPIDLDSLARV